MTSYFRFLWQNKLYTAIEVAGMAVAIAFVVFIGSFVIGQMTADADLKRQGNIYVGHNERMIVGCSTAKEQFEGKFPEEEEICRVMASYYFGGVTAEKTAGDYTEWQNALMVDENFFQFFPFALAEGSRQTVLADRNSVLLSASCAARLFADKNPMGEMVTVTLGDKSMSLTVSGIFDDFRNTVLHAPDIIYRLDAVRDIAPHLLQNGNGITTLFFRLAPGADAEALSGRMLEVLKKEDFLYIYNVYSEYHLTRFADLSDLSLQNVLPFDGIVDGDLVRLFSAAGVLLLVFAVLNYISLTVAQTGFRAKEMASRRLLGAQRGAIVGRYIAESFVLTAVSFGLALVVVELFADSLSELIGKSVRPLEDIGLAEGAFMVALVVVLSLCSGILPALVVAKFKPIEVVRGNFARAGKMTLGRVLVTAQCFVALVTLSVAAVMYLQLSHMVHRPVGYENRNRCTVSGLGKASEYYVDELRSLACVEDVGWLQFEPMGVGLSGTSFNIKGEEVLIDVFYCDKAAFKILGFNVVSQNAETTDGSVYLTESALKALGQGYDCTAIVLDDGRAIPVAGVMSDYIRGSLKTGAMHDGFLPIVWIKEMTGEADFGDLRTLVVKTLGNEDEAAEEIFRFYTNKGFAEDQFHAATYTDLTYAEYSTEDNNMKLIALFTALTLLLSVLAMIAMSTYYARQHAKDAAVRKVMGCSRGRLFAGMAAGFLKSIGIAIVIAVPVAWLVAGNWLQTYSYRIDNSLWPYMLAALAMAVVAVAAISWQAVRLMNTNPVEALKKE